jgi:hypothetical protein
MRSVRGVVDDLHLDAEGRGEQGGLPGELVARDVQALAEEREFDPTVEHARIDPMDRLIVGAMPGSRR